MTDIAQEQLGELAAGHVRMTAGEAGDIAKQLWRLRVSAERLETEKDDTFRLEAEGGSRYVLKVTNPSEDASEIDLECGVIAHVGRSETDVPVPRLLPAVDGRILVSIRDGAGQRRLVRLMTHLDGRPLEATGSTAEQRERLGEMLARLRLAMADYSHPADRRHCAWDISGLPRLGLLIDELDEGQERMALLREGFRRYMEHVAPSVPGLRRQVLHNDFSPSNVLVDPDVPCFVTGIIDFGDAVRTAIAIDVSTALLHQFPAIEPTALDADLFADGRDLLRGYLRCADLTEEELRLLGHLAMGRVIARAIITLFRAARMPENRRHIVRNTEPGWAQLAWFLERTPGEISSHLL